MSKMGKKHFVLLTRDFLQRLPCILRYFDGRYEPGVIGGL